MTADTKVADKKAAEKRAARGTKRTCQSADCETRFYDLNRDPIVCPMCNATYVVEVAPPPPPKPAVVVAPVKPVEKAEPETVDEDAAEVADIETDDKDAPDDTFLETDDEEGSDVAGIVGVAGGEKEEET